MSKRGNISDINSYNNIYLFWF